MTYPPDTNIGHEFDAAHEYVTLAVGDARLRVSAVELEKLAQHLGYLRAHMSPEVAPDVPAGSCPSIDSPRLALQLTPNGLRTAVGIRTPVFGWIAILLDRVQTEGLGAHLTTIAATMSVRAD